MFKGLAKFWQGFSGKVLCLADYYAEHAGYTQYMIRLNPVTMFKAGSGGVSVWFDEVDGSRCNISLDVSIRNKVNDLWRKIDAARLQAAAKFGRNGDEYIFIHLQDKQGRYLMVSKIYDMIAIDARDKNNKLSWYTADNEYSSLSQAINDINFNRYELVAVNS